MNIHGSMDREKAFLKALSQYKATCTELFALIRDEEKAKIRRWEHERPSLELLISSLNQVRWTYSLLGHKMPIFPSNALNPQSTRTVM